MMFKNEAQAQEFIDTHSLKIYYIHEDDIDQEYAWFVMPNRYDSPEDCPDDLTQYIEFREPCFIKPHPFAE